MALTDSIFSIRVDVGGDDRAREPASTYVDGEFFGKAGRMMNWIWA